MIPLHPEAVPGRSDRLRWVVPAGVLGFVGPVARAPGRLGRLVDAGLVAGLEVEPAAVLVTLADGRSWREDGAMVRTALHAALGDPDAWVPSPVAASLDEDALLARVADQVLTGPAGDFVRSHGGVVELVDATGGVVSVRLSGACRGCPATGTTLRDRLERALRTAYPSLKELRSVG
jgi:Fe-S cluster biogenesis protein NfuA